MRSRDEPSPSHLPSLRRRLLFRTQSLRHRRHARLSRTLPRHPSPRKTSCPRASYRSRFCRRSLHPRIPRRQSSVPRHRLGFSPHVHPPARRGRSRFFRLRQSRLRMALARRPPRRRYRPHRARHQSQHARRRKHRPRTFFQLGAQHRRRPSCRLAHLVHDRSPHPRDRPSRPSLNPVLLLTLQTLPLPPPLPPDPLIRPQFNIYRAERMLVILSVSTKMREGPQPISSPTYFVYLSTHSRNVLYQNWLFNGFNTQCPSSGKITSFDGTPCRCNALKNSNDCVYGTR